jgi:uncharacterized protein HemX
MTRLILAAIAILVVMGAVLAMTGVLQVQNNKDESSVTIDKKELKEKTHEAVKKTEEAGGAILDRTGKALHEAADKVRGSSHDQKAPPTAPRLNDKNLPHPDETQHSFQEQGT